MGDILSYDFSDNMLRVDSVNPDGSIEFEGDVYCDGLTSYFKISERDARRIAIHFKLIKPLEVK